MPEIKVIHDKSHRAVQALEVAKGLGAKHFSKRVIITCGREMLAQSLAEVKPGNFLVSILDPGRDYEKFDLVFVPGHDPHPGLENFRTTVGLINQVTPEFLPTKNRFKKIIRSKIGVLIGGRHVGGNFSVADAAELAKVLNKSGFYPLISSSKRTEAVPLEALRKNLSVPYYLFNYNKDGLVANPYYEIMSAASKVIVTADSVRMCSEAASSGRQVFIFAPERVHFSYAALRDNLFAAGAAMDVKNLLDNTATKTLNEAARVAEIIWQESTK